MSVHPPRQASPDKAHRSLWRSVALVLLGAFLLSLLLGGTAVWYLGFHNQGLNLHLDAARIAQAETKMWQAYYTRDMETLGLQLVAILREQFGLSYVTAALSGEELAKAAALFARSKDGYDQNVLPILESAYGRIHAATGGSWEAKKVARAELDWWVARRTPEQNSAENVGAIIAREYAFLYGHSNPEIAQAGLLRAQAAVLRDQGGQNADWPKIQSMLGESYRLLIQGVTGS